MGNGLNGVAHTAASIWPSRELGSAKFADLSNQRSPMISPTTLAKASHSPRLWRAIIQIVNRKS